MINNIQNSSNTGINNDLSPVDSAYPEKNKAIAPGEKNPGAVGFFNTKESRAVSGNRVLGYTREGIDGEKSVDGGDAEKIINGMIAGENNDKELVKNLTGDDYESLDEEGMSLRKFSKERLERAIERIKNNRETKDARLAESIEKRQETRESIDRMAAYTSAKTGAEKTIAKLLYEADLPVTDENIEEIKQAADKAVQSMKLSDSSEGYLIKNNLAPTVENIYKAFHSGEMRIVELDDSDWEKLKENVAGIAEKITDSEPQETFKNIRWLIEREIPVNIGNINYKAGLDVLGSENGISENDIFKAAVDAIKAGGKAEEGLLINPLAKERALFEAEANAVLGKVPLITDADIKQALSGKNEAYDISVRELAAAVTARETDGNTVSYSARETISVELTAKESDTKQKLDEIRFSLNIEAGRRLMAKGINIISDGLMRVTEGIRELEREYLKDIYKEIAIDDDGAPVTEAEADEASALGLKVEKSLNSISNSGAELYKATFDIRHTVTLSQLSEKGEELKRMQVAISHYEESATEVRRDLGDSMGKAFAGSVDSLLDSNGLEITEANRRAVRILGYNEMEISAESIENMKYYDAKLTGLTEKMTPTVVMTMIREGMNPLESTVDELSERASEILKENGNTPEQDYAGFLVKMEESRSITDNERNAYVGIYRLLYNIEKNDGAVIGAALNSGTELTMRNLMALVRSGNTSIDLAADDGTDIRVSSYKNSVTAQIDEAFGYQKELADTVLRTTEASAWQNALSGNDPSAMSIEKLKEALSGENVSITVAEGPGTQSYDIKAGEMVQTMAADTPVSGFLRSMGIKDSFENRILTDDILRHPEKEDSSFTVTKDELTQALESASKTDELLGIRTRMANTLTGQAFKTAITAQAAAELNGRVERVEMLGRLAGKGHFRFNTVDGDGSKQINLTLIKNTGDSGTVSVRIAKEAYELQADMNLTLTDTLSEGPTVNGTIFYSGEAAKEQATVSEGLMESLKEMGLSLGSLTAVQGTRSEEGYLSHISKLAGNRTERSEEGADELYRAAGAFVAAFL